MLILNVFYLEMPQKLYLGGTKINLALFVYFMTSQTNNKGIEGLAIVAHAENYFLKCKNTLTETQIYYLGYFMTKTSKTRVFDIFGIFDVFDAN